MSRDGPNRVMSFPDTRMIGMASNAEIVMKIGNVLMPKLDSKIASRAALPATNPATTTSAVTVAIRPARCWLSSAIMTQAAPSTW